MLKHFLVASVIGALSLTSVNAAPNIITSIGYDHYKQLDEGKFNFNLGLDCKLTDKVLIGAKIKEHINQSTPTYQGVLTYKW